MELPANVIKSRHTIVAGTRTILSGDDWLLAPLDLAPSKVVQPVNPVLAEGGQNFDRRLKRHTLSFSRLRVFQTHAAAAAAMVNGTRNEVSGQISVTLREAGCSGTLTLAGAVMAEWGHGIWGKFVRTNFSLPGGAITGSLVPLLIDTALSGLVYHDGFTDWFVPLAAVPSGSTSDADLDDVTADWTLGGLLITSGADERFLPLNEMPSGAGTPVPADSIIYDAALGGLRVTLGSDTWFAPLDAVPG